VHVWFLQNEDLLRSIGMGLESTEVDELVEETRVEHEKWLDELLSEYDLTDLTTKVHLIKGEPGSEIPKLVAKVEADLVVMGTVARTGIAGFFIGNTAEKILHSVDSSVLTVKPSSFQTPVR
jgi:nucleotide-binding universal stress UspA family protein